MKYKIVSEVVVVDGEKLLVVKYIGHDYYRLPGTVLRDSDKSLESMCINSTREETFGIIKIIKPLHPILLRKLSRDGEEIIAVFVHYGAELLNKSELRAIEPVQEVRWINIRDIEKGRCKVSDDIIYLIGKGDIK